MHVTVTFRNVHTDNANLARKLINKEIDPKCWFCMSWNQNVRMTRSYNLKYIQPFWISQLPIFHILYMINCQNVTFLKSFTLPHSTQSRFVFSQLLIFPYDKIAAEKEISNYRQDEGKYKKTADDNLKTGLCKLLCKDEAMLGEEDYFKRD